MQGCTGLPLSGCRGLAQRLFDAQVQVGEVSRNVEQASGQCTQTSSARQRLYGSQFTGASMSMLHMELFS